MKKWLRTPRNKQEKAKWFDALEQGIKPRAARSPKRLVDDRDDKPVHKSSYKKRKAKNPV